MGTESRSAHNDPNNNQNSPTDENNLESLLPPAHQDKNTPHHTDQGTKELAAAIKLIDEIYANPDASSHQPPNELQLQVVRQFTLSHNLLTLLFNQCHFTEPLRVDRNTTLSKNKQILPSCETDNFAAYLCELFTYISGSYNSSLVRGAENNLHQKDASGCFGIFIYNPAEDLLDQQIYNFSREVLSLVNFASFKRYDIDQRTIFIRDEIIEAHMKNSIFDLQLLRLENTREEVATLLRKIDDNPSLRDLSLEKVFVLPTLVSLVRLYREGKLSGNDFSAKLKETQETLDRQIDPVKRRLQNTEKVFTSEERVLEEIAKSIHLLRNACKEIFSPKGSVSPLIKISRRLVDWLGDFDCASEISYLVNGCLVDPDFFDRYPMVYGYGLVRASNKSPDNSQNFPPEWLDNGRGKLDISFDYSNFSWGTGVMARQDERIG